MKLWKKIALGSVGLLVLSQLVPVNRANPPVVSEPAMSSEVRAVLRDACYDCHSNETRWLWYSRVAPASWLIARDVRVGRAHLNFSEWDAMPEKKRVHRLKEIVSTVKSGEMPLWFYTPLHPEAVMSAEQKQLLVGWANGMLAPPAAGH